MDDKGPNSLGYLTSPYIFKIHPLHSRAGHLSTEQSVCRPLLALRTRDGVTSKSRTFPHPERWNIADLVQEQSDRHVGEYQYQSSAA